jgi:D-alanyl-D-alanine carboxypeptidase
MAEMMADPLQQALEAQQAREHLVQGFQQYPVKVPGMSAAVILPDGSTWLGISGRSWDAEAMRSDLLFGLASVSKTYIGALVAQLVEGGVLSVEDTVGDWLPDLDQIDGSITLQQLLTHTSGLYRYQQGPEFMAAIYAEPERVWTPREIVEEFSGEPECAPGQCFGESAMDYVLLGMMVEKATGTPVSQLLNERFFRPLKLKETYLYPDQRYPVDKMAHMWWDATGSGELVDVVEGSDDPPLAALFSGMWTAGGIHATAEDLARFVKALFEGDLLDEAALDRMLEPGPELGAGVNYGYSVIIQQVDGQTAYWHPGGAGDSSVYFYFPDEGLTIALLANAMVDLEPVAMALYDTYQENKQ